MLWVTLAEISNSIYEVSTVRKSSGRNRSDAGKVHTTRRNYNELDREVLGKGVCRRTTAKDASLKYGTEIRDRRL